MFLPPFPSQGIPQLSGPSSQHPKAGLGGEGLGFLHPNAFNACWHAQSSGWRYQGGRIWGVPLKTKNWAELGHSPRRASVHSDHQGGASATRGGRKRGGCKANSPVLQGAEAQALGLNAIFLLFMSRKLQASGTGLPPLSTLVGPRKVAPAGGEEQGEETEAGEGLLAWGGCLPGGFL